ncbi:MAG TPA: hypothetical protein VK638_00820 [Edaphobacter sp.]|nr:hypothetical protein [Edaphobacter sp.]
MRIDQPRELRAVLNPGLLHLGPLPVQSSVSGADRQACKNFQMALLYSHNFWSFAFTSENHNDCEIPEVDTTGFPGDTRT